MTHTFRAINQSTLDLGNGYTFEWMLSGDEIIGHVIKPEGGILAGSSGWWRTEDPQQAAKRALVHLDLPTTSESSHE